MGKGGYKRLGKSSFKLESWKWSISHGAYCRHGSESDICNGLGPLSGQKEFTIVIFAWSIHITPINVVYMDLELDDVVGSYSSLSLSQSPKICGRPEQNRLYGNSTILSTWVIGATSPSLLISLVWNRDTRMWHGQDPVIPRAAAYVATPPIARGSIPFPRYWHGAAWLHHNRYFVIVRSGIDDFDQL